MERITKKQFKQLHQNKQIGLVHAFSNATKETAKSKLSLFDVDTIKSKSIKLSRVDVENQGDYYIQTAYEDGLFVYLEALIDHSKDRYTSRDYKQTNVIVYFKL